MAPPTPHSQISDPDTSSQETVPKERYDALLKEFDDFLYTVSHDLGAPIRHVREFSKILTGRLEGKLDESEQKFIQVLNQSSQKLNLMLDGLVKLSRVNTQSEPHEPVDLNTVIETVREELSQEIYNSRASITVDSLPVVTGEVEQLTHVFSELLQNALRCRRANTPLEIHIHAEETPENHLLYIDDNGCGIDPSSAPHIFSLFKSFDTDAAPAGVGVGLTLCQKIATAHQGSLHHSPLTKGKTRFTLTLPK